MAIDCVVAVSGELPVSIVSVKVNSKAVFLLPSHVDLKDGAAGSLPNVDDTAHFCAVQEMPKQDQHQQNLSTLRRHS